MKISFLVPAYNEEKIISKCIESILKEIKSTNQDAELIVINNASTDRTKEIASSYEGVKVVDEPSKGVTKAKQAGYKNATGDLIVNIDADNIVPEGWLKRVVNHFEKNDKLVGLSGPLYYYDLSHFTNFWVSVFYSLGYVIHMFNHMIGKGGTMFQGGNFIIKKTALDNVGGFNTDIMFYGEDTEIATRIRKIGHVVFDFKLYILSSGRRLKKEGVLKTAWNYAINYISMTFMKKPIEVTYNDIRE